MQSGRQGDREGSITKTIVGAIIMCVTIGPMTVIPAMGKVFCRICLEMGLLGESEPPQEGGSLDFRSGISG